MKVKVTAMSERHVLMCYWGSIVRTLTYPFLDTNLWQFPYKKYVRNCETKWCDGRKIDQQKLKFKTCFWAQPVSFQGHVHKRAVHTEANTSQLEEFIAEKEGDKWHVVHLRMESKRTYGRIQT